VLAPTAASLLLLMCHWGQILRLHFSTCVHLSEQKPLLLDTQARLLQQQMQHSNRTTPNLAAVLVSMTTRSADRIVGAV
jgi:hypothetical protein